MGCNRTLYLWLFNEKIENLDKKIDGVESRLNEKIDKLDKKIDTSIEKLDKKIDKVDMKFDRLQWLIVATIISIFAKDYIIELLHKI